MRHFIRSTVLAVTLLCGASPSIAQQASSRLPHSPQPIESSKPLRTAPLFSLSPASIEFEKNLGQVLDRQGHPMPNVLYRIRAHGSSAYLTRNGMSFVFTKHSLRFGEWIKKKRSLGDLRTKSRLDTVRAYRIDLNLAGSNPSPVVSEDSMLDLYSNYYGRQYGDRMTFVPSFRRLVYHDVYPDIDMVFYGDDQGMKYDFVVRPGGKPSMIRMACSDPDSLHILEDGSMWIRAALGFVQELAPRTYTLAARTTIGSRFEIRSGSLGFWTTPYDSSQTLVIDPPRVWGTYLGGDGGIWNGSSTIDKDNNIIVDGGIFLDGGLATPGSFQDTLIAVGAAFIAKFHPSGSLLWATYYGSGVNGEACPIITDSAGNIFFLSYQNGVNPTPGAYQTIDYGGGTDLILAKFSPLGTQVWATYFGGEGDQGPLGMAIDSANNVVINGWTTSAGHIATAGAYQTILRGNPVYSDFFIAKFANAGAIIWSTYFGRGGGGINEPNSQNMVACDRFNNIYFTGTAYDTGFIATPGEFLTDIRPFGDTWYGSILEKFSPSGQRIWGTYIPSLNAHIGVDRDSNVYVAGDYPYATYGTPGTFGPAFDSTKQNYLLLKLSSSGHRRWGSYYYSERITSTFDSSYMITGGVSVDNHSNVLICGSCSTDTLLATQGEYQMSYGGGSWDGYIIKFDSAGKRKWATLYGGEGDEIGYSVNLDRLGHIVLSGITTSGNAISSPGAYQTMYDTGTGSFYSKYDGFVASFCDTVRALLLATAADTICYGTPDTLTGTSGYASYQWRNNGVVIPGATSNKYILPDTLKPGPHRFTLDIADPELCATATDTLPIFVRTPPPIDGGPDKTMCLGSSVQIGKTVAKYTYRWSPGKSLFDSTVARPIALSTQTTTYVVSITDTNGCQNSDTVIVNVNNPPIVDAGPDQTICSGSSVRIGKSILGKAPFIVSWLPAFGLDRTDTLFVNARPATTTSYTVTVTDSNGCESTSSVTVHVNTSPVIRALPAVAICKGDSTLIGATFTIGGTVHTIQWKTSAGLSDSTAQFPMASPDSTTVYVVTLTDQHGCQATDSIKVAVHAHPQPIVALGGASTFCSGDSVTLDAGTGYVRYLWSSGQKTRKIVVHQSGQFDVVVTDSNGCSGTSAPVTIIVLPLPLADLQGPNSVCPNSVDAYSISDGNTNTIVWTLSGGGVIQSGQGSNTLTVKWATTGTWTLSVHVATPAGCTKDTSITVLVDAVLHPSVAPSGNVKLCQGDEVVLHAPPGYRTYHWSSGETVDSIIVTKAGSYYVSVTDDQGCSGSSLPVVVVVDPEPKPQPVIVSAGSAICQGDSIALLTSANYAMYLWSTGETTSKIWASTAGSYSVTVSDTFGCLGTSAPIALEVAPKPVVTIVPPGPLTFCQGDSATLMATPGMASYRWSSGDTAASIVVRISGSYRVIVSNSAGCEDTSASVSLTVIPNPAKPIITRNGNTLTASPVTGIAAFAWTLNSSPVNGVDTASVDASRIGEGTYVVTVTNASGCSSTSDPIEFADSGSAVVAVAPLTRANPGDHVLIPMTLMSSHNLLASGATTFVAEVRFNSTLLAPIGLPSLGVIAGNNRIVTVTGPVAQPTGLLQNLNFVATLGTDTCTDLTIDTFYFPAAAVNVMRENGEFCLTGVCMDRGRARLIDPNVHISLSEIRPNPSVEAIDFDYQLAEEGPTRIFVQDLLGRTTLVIRDEWRKPGSYHEFVNIAQLPNGAYLLILRTPTDVLTKRMEVVK